MLKFGESKLISSKNFYKLPVLQRLRFFFYKIQLEMALSSIFYVEYKKPVMSMFNLIYKWKIAHYCTGDNKAWKQCLNYCFSEWLKIF